MKQILLGVQDLLDSPNQPSPAQSEAYMLFTSDRVEYDKKVKAQSLRYPPRVGLGALASRLEARRQLCPRRGVKYPSKPPRRRDFNQRGRYSYHLRTRWDASDVFQCVESFSLLKMPTVRRVPTAEAPSA